MAHYTHTQPYSDNPAVIEEADALEAIVGPLVRDAAELAGGKKKVEILFSPSEGETKAKVPSDDAFIELQRRFKAHGTPNPAGGDNEHWVLIQLYGKHPGPDPGTVCVVFYFFKNSRS